MVENASAVSKLEQTEYKIQIEFIFEKNLKLFKKAKHVIQNKPYKYGLRIKNIDTKNSPKARVYNFNVRPSDSGMKIENFAHEEFSLKELNPGEEIELWWPDLLTTVFQGGAWVSCDVEPIDLTASKFATYQYDIHCKKEFKNREHNQWGDGFIIRGQLEQQQALTNILMFVLTLLVFFDGVWGLGNIFKFLFKVMGIIFLKLSLFMNFLG